MILITFVMIVIIIMIIYYAKWQHIKLSAIEEKNG